MGRERSEDDRAMVDDAAAMRLPCKPCNACVPEVYYILLTVVVGHMVWCISCAHHSTSSKQVELVT